MGIGHRNGGKQRLCIGMEWHAEQIVRTGLACLYKLVLQPLATLPLFLLVLRCTTD